MGAAAQATDEENKNKVSTAIKFLILTIDSPLLRVKKPVLQRLLSENISKDVPIHKQKKRSLSKKF